MYYFSFKYELFIVLFLNFIIISYTTWHIMFFGVFGFCKYVLILSVSVASQNVLEKSTIWDLLLASLGYTVFDYCCTVLLFYFFFLHFIITSFFLCFLEYMAAANYVYVLVLSVTQQSEICY